MKPVRPSATAENASYDPSGGSSIISGIALLVGALIGAVIGYMTGGQTGAWFGGVIGALIGVAAAGLYSRGEGRGTTAASAAAISADRQPRTADAAADISHPAVSRRDTDISSARRSDEAATSSTQNAWNRVDRSGTISVPLAEEKLEIDKRELEAGRLRLRKVVRTEVVQVPVELRREEIVVERVEPGSSGEASASEPIEYSDDGEIVIRLVKEEPVVQKEAKVFSEVHVHKVVHTETKNVRETLRREDVTVHRDDK